MNFNMELTGFDLIELTDLLKLDGAGDDPPREDPVCGDRQGGGASRKMGHGFRADMANGAASGRLRDCLQSNQLFDDKKYDLLVTDPPYGVSYASKNTFLNAIDKGNRIQTPIACDHQKPEEMSAFWKKLLRPPAAMPNREPAIM